MATLLSPTSPTYATPPTNYTGTTLFLTYIAAALYAIISITYSHYTQFTNLVPSKDEKVNKARAARARHITIYAFLESISFATLSYNMLMFLITHYLEWSGDVCFTVKSVDAGKLGKWMLESSLFQDFAGDLVKNAPNALITQTSILATWFWSIWVAQKARQRHFDASRMWRFILLSQILPVSLMVTMFLVQLHLASPDIQAETKEGETKLKQTGRKPIASLQIPNILLNASLLALPALRSNPIFMVLVLVTRAILLLPHSGLVSLRDAEVVKCITVSGGFVIANAAMMRKDLTFGGVVGALAEGGYAVKALGWDALLGLLVYVVLGWGGGV